MIPGFGLLILIYFTLPETRIWELLQAGVQLQFSLSSFSRYLGSGNCLQVSHSASATHCKHTGLLRWIGNSHIAEVAQVLKRAL